MQEVRKANSQPLWMGEAAYAKLSAYWTSPDFVNKSDLAKRNRNVDAGACMHTTGSKPHSVVWLEMVSLIYYYKLNIITSLNTKFILIDSLIMNLGGEEWWC